MDALKSYEGKQVFIKLKNGRSYSGKVLEIEIKPNCTLIILLDKYDKKVGFYSTEISVIEEEAER